jgi:hypothetical protein
MCSSKRSGGMRFRDYVDFNQALLAKQAWRMITNPESLCARVLKARYADNRDLLSAKCPKRSSYTWRSVLHGRDLLKEGLFWRVGDGKKIKVWEHNWIPRSYHMRPMGIKPSKEVSLVSELLLPDGAGWNVDKLNDCFFEADVSDILKIPVGRAGSVDYMAWNYSKNGVFSVRSAYHLKQQIQRGAAGEAGLSRNTTEH